MKAEFELEQVTKIVKDHLIPKLKKYSIFTFSGPLGAGKTTLIKELFKQCGIKEPVTSPTFTYLNIYKTKDGKIFHHFDLYRMKDEDSFISAGLDEYLYKEPQEENCFTFIEWPEVIKILLQNEKIEPKICKITLNYNPKNFDHRIIEIKTE